MNWRFLQCCHESGVRALRIKDIQQVPTGSQRLGSVDEKRSVGGFEHEFQRQKHDTSAAEYEEYLHDLTQKIHLQGKLVSGKADLAEFQKFRALISELLNETVSNAYSFHKASHFDARGRHKVFALIRKVNKNLDDLASEILSQEADSIKLLSLVDDIRGLLVDLFY